MRPVAIESTLLLLHLFTVNFIYLFVFPSLVTLSIPHAEKLHCCRNKAS